jgi:hypothetical protein
MLESNLDVSMLLSQHEVIMILIYQIMQTPLSCYGNLLYVKPEQLLTIYYSLLRRSLRFSYGQHDIESGLPTALHVTLMNVKHKADVEHSLAMFEVMSRIKNVY